MSHESKSTPIPKREELAPPYQFRVEVPDGIHVEETEPIDSTEDVLTSTGVFRSDVPKPDPHKHLPPHMRRFVNPSISQEKQPVVSSVPVSSAEDFSKHEDITADTFTENSLWHQADDLDEGYATLVRTIDPKSVRRESLKRSARKLSRRIRSLLLSQKT